jgi:CHAT domain-containing protein
LTPTDSAFLTRSLEASRRYDNLLTLLDKELAAIEQEREATQKEDLVSKLLILDDIAEIYATGLVNFEKALEMNQRALATYERLREAKDNTLEPSYVNRRRFEYWYIYPAASPRVEYAATMLGVLGAAAYLMPGGQGSYQSVFPDTFLRLVREEDIERARERIERRSRLIAEKLGKAAPVQPYITSGPVSMQDELSIGARILDSGGIYNAYYTNWLLAARAWARRHEGGQGSRYVELQSVAQGALEAAGEGRQSEDFLTRAQLHYWLGAAQLEAGRLAEGIQSMEQFVRAIDEDEAAMASRDERRQRAYRRSRVLLYAVLLPLMVLSGAASGGPGLVGAVAAGASMVPIAVGGAYGVETVALKGVRELSAYRTEYATKLNRILSKYEQLEFFYELGRAYEETGNISKAIEHYKEAIAIIESQRATIANEAERILFLRDKEAPYKRLIPLLIRQGEFDGAFEYMERARSRAFVDLLGSTQLVLRSKEETDAYEKMLRTRSEIDTILDQVGLGLPQAQTLTAKMRDFNVAAASVPGQSLEFQSFATVQTAGVKDVAKELGESDALVTYYVGDETLSILLLQDGHLTGWVQPVNREGLLEILPRFRSAIERPPTDPRESVKASEDEARRYGQILYDLLWNPMEKSLRKVTVYVVPHGPLHYLPFAALHNGEQYLVDRYALATVPSATVLTFLAAKPRASTDAAVVFANPDVGDTQLDLRYAEEEGRAIQAVLPKVQMFARREATKARAVALAPTPGVLHFATHGTFNLDRPLDSALLLAGEGGTPGPLTAKEIFSLRLPGNLVVLSACQTGLSRVAAGDELIGLTRAFMYAGAPTLVATLWNVSDRATADLMGTFYQELRDRPKAEALRAAQLAIRQRYPHPFFWAPFIVVGDLR